MFIVSDIKIDEEFRVNVLHVDRITHNGELLVVGRHRQVLEKGATHAIDPNDKTPKPIDEVLGKFYPTVQAAWAD